MRRVSLRRPGDGHERGAVAVMVAILMVTLLGFVALAVDIGRVAGEKSQLQNAADASALAVAENCANKWTRSTCTPAADSIATFYSRTNTNDGSGVPSDRIEPNTTAGTVTVNTSTASGNVQTTFARIIGIDSVPVAATATATWGYPKSGLSALPLAFSACELDVHSTAANPIPQKVVLQGGGTPDCNGKNPSNQTLPGGFAWLSPTGPGPCDVKVTAGPESDLSTWIKTSSGASIPNVCKYLFDTSDPRNVLGKTVALPVYDDIATTPPTPNPSATGANTWYHVAKWAGFHVLGWKLASTQAGPNVWGGAKGIYGYFIGFSADPATFGDFTTDPNGQGNLYVVKLIK